mmetsp:Transcript_25045/g.51811  ORF Transcript_25045/g.51811 Transcript_25045/m.51811 type:complete len:242 (+) Transcript_25045:144-869(+)
MRRGQNPQCRFEVPITSALSPPPLTPPTCTTTTCIYQQLVPPKLSPKIIFTSIHQNHIHPNAEHPPPRCTDRRPPHVGFNSTARLELHGYVYLGRFGDHTVGVEGSGGLARRDFICRRALGLHRHRCGLGHGGCEPDVKRALVCEEARVLHGQYPRLLVTLIVVRVPPARRSQEHGARGPVATDRVFDPRTRLVKLGAHQRVHTARRRSVHREVERDAVVAVGLLVVVCRQHIQQRPERRG